MVSCWFSQEHLISHNNSVESGLVLKYLYTSHTEATHTEATEATPSNFLFCLRISSSLRISRGFTCDKFYPKRYNHLHSHCFRLACLDGSF